MFIKVKSSQVLIKLVTILFITSTKFTFTYIYIHKRSLFSYFDIKKYRNIYICTKILKHTDFTNRKKTRFHKEYFLGNIHTEKEVKER